MGAEIRALDIAENAQRRFYNDPILHARSVLVDRIVAEDVATRLGRELTESERDAARHAAAIALVVAEMPIEDVL